MRAFLSGSRPWFAVPIAMWVLALVVGGTAAEVLFSVGGLLFLLACAHWISLAVRDDPVRSKLVARRAGLVGLMAEESGTAQRRRARDRARRTSG